MRCQFCYCEPTVCVCMGKREKEEKEGREEKNATRMKKRSVNFFLPFAKSFFSLKRLIESSSELLRFFLLLLFFWSPTDTINCPSCRLKRVNSGKSKQRICRRQPPNAPSFPDETHTQKGIMRKIW